MSEFNVPKAADEAHAEAQEKLKNAQKLLDQEAEARRAQAQVRAREGDERALFEEHIGPVEAPEEPEEFDDLADVEITEDDKNAFFESVLAGGNFGEEYDLFDGRLKVLLRARKAKESESALLDSGKHDAQSVVDYEALFLARNLAFALVHIKSDRGKETFYDEGDLKERIARIHDMPTPLYTALIEILGRFDRKVAKLSRMSTQPDFWHPASDT